MAENIFHPTHIKAPLSYEPDYRGRSKDEVYPIKDAEGRTVATAPTLAGAVMLAAAFNFTSEAVSFLQYPILVGLKARLDAANAKTLETMLADYERECQEWERLMEEREKAREAEREKATAFTSFKYGDRVMVREGYPRAGAIGWVRGIKFDEGRFKLVVLWDTVTPSKGYVPAETLVKLPENQETHDAKTLRQG